MTTSPSAPAPGGQPPALRAPAPGALFDHRAARLAALTRGHAAPEWLALLARIAAGQALAVRGIRTAAVRVAGGGPPLAHDRLPRDGAWRRMLATIVAAAAAPGLPVQTDEALRRLAGSSVDALETLADGVFGGAVAADQLSSAPFIGAALQAWLASLAAEVDPAIAAPAEGSCPVCGGPPLAAVVQAADRLRYVSCAYCSSAWNLPRVRCVSCGGGEGLEYLHVDGDPGAKAEVCPSCRVYLKVFDEEKRPGVEPAADDAATLALDLLVANEGYARAGPNLYVGVQAG